jgi:acetyl-CoA acetyltransferase
VSAPGSAITGIGWTTYSKNSGTTVTNLALEACQKAIADAGVPVEDVQSIITFGLNDSVHPQAVATGLGLPRIDHYLNIFGGGQVCCATIAFAEMLIESGRTEHVLIFRALNGRSGPRLGGTGMEEYFARGEGEAQFTFPYGWISFPQYIAMSARRHMIEYGTTSDAFAEVALTGRENAVLNDRAIMRKPMTIDDYYGSRMLADPLRLFDICLESDGACALLVSRADLAEGLNHPVVNVLSAVQGGGPRSGYAFDGYFAFEDHGNLYGKYISEPLWGRAGVGPEDVDVASIYDCFTYSVLSQLEGLGFCAPGEGKDFVKDGRIRRDGDLPINTNGGMLSEAYVHGINGIAEVVSQLRGDAGERQVEDARVGIATGFGTTTGCATVLARA